MAKATITPIQPTWRQSDRSARQRERRHRVALRAAAERQLRYDDGQANGEPAEQIEQQEHRPAVLAGDVGEAPDNPQPHRCADRGEHEAAAGSPLLTRGHRAPPG
jgi:hypothetical protein